jgi:predicted phosphoribosyltransferase
MIQNDQELKTAQERIDHFCRLLAQMRVTARPEEYTAVSSGYRDEIAKMQKEVLEYLSHHANERLPAEAA